jgi:hypothetical protein
MAGKRFHITPNGPKRCTATFRPCPFSDHYGSEESAVAADRVIQANNAHRAELKRLEDNHRNPDPRYFSRTGFNFDEGSTSPRKFGQEIDARIDGFGVKPQVYHSMGQFRLNNGNGFEVNMQVMRMTEIDPGLARYTGVWRFINKSNRLGLHRSPTTNSDIVLDFSTAQAAKRSMLQAREIFRNAVIASGIFDDEELDRRADSMTENFKNMFNAVESDAAGDFDLWDRGMGYFTKSDSDTIIVDENYRTSAFRAENFRNFIRECPYYHSVNPNAEIRVRDQHSRTGASWTLKRESDQWSVDKTYADGRSETVLINDPQEALDHIYYHNLAEINPGNEQESLEKGRYAGELVKQVEICLEENKAVVEKYWQDSSSMTIEKANAIMTGEIYDLKEEPKGSMMAKIFETFT